MTDRKNGAPTEGRPYKLGHYLVLRRACLRRYGWMLVAFYVLSVIGSLEATFGAFEYVRRVDFRFPL